MTTESMPIEPKVSPRNPWLAAFLSILSPGVGQMYAGDLRRGLVALAAILTNFLISLLVLPYSLMTAAIFFSLGTLSLHFFILLDAAILATRKGAAYQLKRFNRVPAYLTYILVSMVLVVSLASYINQKMQIALQNTFSNLQTAIPTWPLFETKPSPQGFDPNTPSQSAPVDIGQ